MDNAQWFLSKYESIHQDWTNETRCFRYKLDAVLQMANHFNDIFDPVKKYANKTTALFLLKNHFHIQFPVVKRNQIRCGKGHIPEQNLQPIQQMELQISLKKKIIILK